MKIAIIGGGGAGLTTAYLLDRVHNVTVFEKQSVLGGNIRTLNKNVVDVEIPSDLAIDNGVIEFQRDHFVNFHKLMKQLRVETEVINGGSSSLYLTDGSYVRSPGIAFKGSLSFPQKLNAAARLLPVAMLYGQFRRQSNRALDHFKHQPMSAYLQNNKWHKWLRMLLMYAYSIPYAQIDEFPAEIAMPVLRASGPGTRWSRVVGGVYTYFEKILAKFGGSIYCDAHITAVRRYHEGIEISLAAGESLVFDKVVFATPPDQVLKLLVDSTEAELRRFGAWKANLATTVIHTDHGLYEQYGSRYYTEFDLFEKEDGDAGYNAYLNRLSGLPTAAPHYCLAYNLRERLDPTKIIHQQVHHTPLYTTAALRFRDEVTATNGQRHTYHAGAYLDNGLHEGAINSALAVSILLEGKTLD